MSEPSSHSAPAPYTAKKARKTCAEWKEKKLHVTETTDHALRALDLTTAMRSLPFELRDKIFRLVIVYDEVLKLWYRETFVRLGEDQGPNPYDLRDLKPAAFLGLRKLRVDYNYKDYKDLCLFPDLDQGKEKYNRILLAENLQEICLDVSKIDSSDVKKYCEELVAMWLTHFKTVKKFTIEGVRHNFDDILMDNSKVQNLKASGVGVTETMRPFVGDDSEILILTTVNMALWEAEKGEFLSWGENL